MASSEGSIALCSQATLLLGEGTIESFDADDDIGAICGNMYDTLVNGWLANYDWTFCKVKAKLARLTETPTTGWKYAFQLPTDRLKPDFAVFNTDAVGASSIRSFDIMADTLLANDEEIWVDYTARPDESLWPAYFKLFAVNALAASLAMPITQDKSLADFYAEKAFGPASDTGRGGLYGMAMLSDSQIKPNTVIVHSPLIEARFS